MYCPQCGNKISDNAKFCGSCGKSVEKKSGEGLPEKTYLAIDTQKDKGKKSHLKLFATIFWMVIIVGSIVFMYLYRNIGSVTQNMTASTSDNIGANQSGQTQTGENAVSPQTSGGSSSQKVLCPANNTCVADPNAPVVSGCPTGYDCKPIATTNSTPDLPSVVAEWSPRVVRIDCSDSNYISTGSGVITWMNWPTLNNSNAPTLVTNKHVITDETSGYLYTTCDFAEPGVSQGVTLYMDKNIIQSDSQDVAYFPTHLTVADLLPGMPTTAMKICGASDATVGDAIAILGYPVDGGTGNASTAITLTQGIISSYDGEYYVTDAKIDHGNSGGAAILLKDDCYLGIPTWAQSGGFESFGRILAAQYIFK
jgi:hypothetical protein